MPRISRSSSWPTLAPISPEKEKAETEKAFEEVISKMDTNTEYTIGRYWNDSCEIKEIPVYTSDVDEKQAKLVKIMMEQYL